MCWVVDGARWKRDRTRFVETLQLGRLVQQNPPICTVPTESNTLLRKWENSKTVVVFDFGELDTTFGPFQFGAPILWMGHPGRDNGQTVLRPIFRSGFVDILSKT